MGFGIGDILSMVAPIAGAAMGGSGKTQTTQPIFDPRANELLDMLTPAVKNAFNKPYQSPFMMSYNPQNIFEQSPQLQAISDAVKRAQMPQQQQPQQQQTPATDPNAASVGQSLYYQMLSDPYGMMGSNVRGGRANYMNQVPQNPVGADFANFGNNWMHAVNAAYQSPEEIAKAKQASQPAAQSGQPSYLDMIQAAVR